MNIQLTTAKGKCFKKRRREAIIRYHHINRNRNPESYAQQMLTLYTPRHQFDDLLRVHDSYVEAWAAQAQDAITKEDYELFENVQLQDVDLHELEDKVWKQLENEQGVDMSDHS